MAGAAHDVIEGEPEMYMAVRWETFRSSVQDGCPSV
jgi:hypothetical protein